ncbi:MAG: urease accessory UreF family protein [Nitrospirota bacterium]
MRSDDYSPDGATVFFVLTAAENAVQRRSYLERILKVPRGYASGAFGGSALPDNVLAAWSLGRTYGNGPLNNPMNTLSLLNGLRFVDSFFPSGGYAFSYGLDAAVQGGAVRNSEELSRYVMESLTTGMGEREAVAVGLGHEAVVSGILETAFETDRELEAMKLGRETRTASQQMGRQVIRLAANQQARHPLIEDYHEAVEAEWTPDIWP